MTEPLHVQIASALLLALSDAYDDAVAKGETERAAECQKQMAKCDAQLTEWEAS